MLYCFRSSQSNEKDKGLIKFGASSPPPSHEPASPLPVPAVSFGVFVHQFCHNESEEESTLDSTPIVAGVISGVAASAALIALAVSSKRRRVATKKIIQPPLVHPTHDDDNLEQGGDAPQLEKPPSYEAALTLDAGGNGSSSHEPKATLNPYYRHADAGGAEGGNILPALPPPSLAEPRQSSAEHTANVTGGGDAELAGGSSAADSSVKASTDTSSTTRASTVSISTHERAEVAQFQQRQRMADAPAVAGGPRPEETRGGNSEESSEADRPKKVDGIGLGPAVLTAAQELARSCQIPGVGEAAAMLCIMANLVIDSRENDRSSDSRLRQCRSIVLVLKRAEKVIGKVS